MMTPLVHVQVHVQMASSLNPDALVDIQDRVV